VNQAFDGLGETFAFFWDAFARAIDGAGGTLEATVHYGEKYDNAFWNGERMVFGDGDGEVFAGFTGSLSVIAHELGHGVVEAAAGSSTRDSRARSTSRSPTCSARSPSSTRRGRPPTRRRG
jgi:Zn-dependent metalloprotease